MFQWLARLIGRWICRKETPSVDTGKLYEVIGRQQVDILVLQAKLAEATKENAGLKKKLGEAMRDADGKAACVTAAN